MGSSVDSQQWYVNVDATTPNSIAIRTAAKFERWHIIMGTWDRSPASRSLILDPGAESNWIEIQPQLWTVDGYENHSGFSNNVFVQIPKHTNAINGTLQDQTHLVLDYSTFNDGPGVQNTIVQDKLDIDKARVMLEKLKGLYTDGLITEKEYDDKRKQIINQI